MVMVAKLSLGPAVMAANRAALYNFVPQAQTHEQFLEAERERKRAYRARKKAELERVTGRTTQPAIEVDAEIPDVEIKIEIVD